MLHAKVKKSPHARARILSIDTSRAEALPGVRAVLTGQELDYRLGLYVVDKDILAKDDVRHFGEAVAAVAADTLGNRQPGGRADRRRVRGPRRRSSITWTRSSRRRAARPPRPRQLLLRRGRVQPQPGTNIANLTKLRKGDVEEGFAEAEWIIEREYTNPSVQHVPMETHVAIVAVEGAATRSPSGPARSRRSPSATCSATPSSCRSTRCG